MSLPDKIEYLENPPCPYYNAEHKRCTGMPPDFGPVLCDGDRNYCQSVTDTTDKVNHPSHYNEGGIECIDALEAAVTGLTGIEAFDTANAIKYLWRWKYKNGTEDLNKAIWYIEHLKQHVDKNS